MSFNKCVSHPGYSRHAYDEHPSRVIISVFVPCGPIEDGLSTSALVKAFLGLLNGAATTEVVRTLAFFPDDVSWHSYSSNGPLNNQAVLAHSADDSEVPIATALLNLNDSSIKYQHFQDPNRAELILTIELRGENGAEVPPLLLSGWHGWLLKVFRLPEAFAQFLTKDVTVPTFDDMQVLLGVCFEGHNDLRDLIEAGHFQLPPGAINSRSIPIYFLADRDGKEPVPAAVDALRACCDYGLHVHGYEAELEALRPRRAPL